MVVLRNLNTVSNDRLRYSIKVEAQLQSTANTILSIDLSQNWTNATVAIHSTTKPNGVPSLNHGSLWYDESTELLYTGYTGTSSSFDINSDPQPPDESVWTFKPDNFGSGTWNQTIFSNASIWNVFKRTNRGYQAYGNGSAYILGGTDLLLYGKDIISGMIKFDMSAQVFTNFSAKTGATSPSGNPGYEGAMQYVPSFGPGGVFVVMGGADTNGFIDFGYVQVYDPASGSWFNQTTTGSKPASRVNFCAAGAPSTNSTYEIFVYAGDNGNLGTASVPFDTVNILSLPAFNWFSVAYNPHSPRSGHTCESVGGSLIAIVGGIDSNPNQTTGSFNDVVRSTFTSPDPFAQGLAIFDLQTLDFPAKYTTGGGTVYEPNKVIRQFYAQGSYGGNLVAGVAQLMKVTHFPASKSSNSTASNSTSSPPSTTSSSSSPHTNHAGAIAGGVIGGLLGIALVVTVMLWLLRRRRRRARLAAELPQRPSWEEKDENARAELEQPKPELEQPKPELGYGEPHELDPVGHP